MPAQINAKDLTPEQRRELGIRIKTIRSVKKETIRKRAIAMLATISDLSQADRNRVLKHASLINKV